MRRLKVAIPERIWSSLKYGAGPSWSMSPRATAKTASWRKVRTSADVGGNVLGVRDRRIDVERGERVRKKSNLVKADLSKAIRREAVRDVKIENRRCSIM